MNRKCAVDDPLLFVAYEAVLLKLLGDGACCRHQVERGLHTADIGTALDVVEGAEHGATECRGGVIAPRGKRGLSPEVEPVDVAVRKVHRTLMRLVVVFTRSIRRHRKPARDNGAVRAPQWGEIGFCDRWIKVIGGKWAPADPHVHVIPGPRQLHRLRGGANTGLAG